MLNLIITTLKIGAFSVLVLVLGQVIEWRGISVSDQIKSGLSSSQISIPKQDLSHLSLGTQLRHPQKSTAPASQNAEGISESERQKLKKLVQDLNSP